MLLYKKEFKLKFFHVKRYSHNISMLKVIQKLDKKNRFINVNNTPLNIKLLIRYNQAKNNKNLTSYIQTGLVINSNFIPAKNKSRFIVLIISGSYKSNVTKILEYIFYSSYMLNKKKRVI